MNKTGSILILEDEYRLAEDWGDAFRRENFDVEHFASADAARKRIKEKRFDLVILDIFIRDEKGIPVADGGIKLMAHIQAEFREADRPKSIGVTGAVPSIYQFDPLTIIDGLGADIILRKPFTPEELLKAVVRLIGS